MFLHYVSDSGPAVIRGLPLYGVSEAVSLSLIRAGRKKLKNLVVHPYAVFLHIFLFKNYMCTNLRFSHFSHVLKKDYYLLFNPQQ